jgi:hypothetical protein
VLVVGDGPGPLVEDPVGDLPPVRAVEPDRRLVADDRVELRLVTDILLDGTDWGASAFADWVDERRERMHRLLVAAHVATRLRCDFTDAGRRRRRKALDAVVTEPAVLAQVLCVLVGPEAFPAGAFTDEAVGSTMALC